MKWLGALAVVAVMGLSLPPATTQAQQSGATELVAAELVQEDLARLVREIRNTSNGQAQRDEAARRLVSRRSPQAWQVLAEVLVDVANPNAQLAAARALASQTSPDPELVNPLFALLGPNKPLSDAAAQALAGYRNNTQVLNRLIGLAAGRQQQETVRSAAIRALGSFVERRAAETLVGVLVRDDEPAALRQGAADALIEMTGLRANGRDVERWQRWWSDNAAKSETEWRADLLQTRAIRYDQVQQRYTHLTQELQTLLEEHYRSAPDNQRVEMVLRYMRSPDPEVRAIGARMIHDDALNLRDRGIAPAARERLRNLAGDSSMLVRLEATRALRVINDPEALDALLAQLVQEPEPEVRSALVRAIAPIRDLRAVPALIVLLRDESPRVVEAAAQALRDLGPPLKEEDPALASRAARELREVVERRVPTSVYGAVREAAIEALVPLSEPAVFSTYANLLRQGEPVAIRRSAVRGLGELRDPRVADTIVRALDDPDPGVRLAAVDALGKTSTFEHAEALYRRLGPAAESSEPVRDRAWRVLESLFPHAREEQLTEWADRFRNDPNRRLTILKALSRQLVGPRREEQLAIVRQNIGSTLMEMNEYAEAALYYKMALEYWQERGRHDYTEGLIRERITALLRARQYPEAMKFASDMMSAERAHQQTMGVAIRAEAERLRDTGELENALLLISAAQRMTPALPEPYAGHLARIQQDIVTRQAEDQQNITPSGPQSVGGRSIAAVPAHGI